MDSLPFGILHALANGFIIVILWPSRLSFMIPERKIKGNNDGIMVRIHNSSPEEAPLRAVFVSNIIISIAQTATIAYADFRKVFKVSPR